MINIMPCAIYKTKKDSHTMQYKLPQKVWIASENVNMEIINVYVIHMQKRWNMCHMIYLEKCALLWEVWTEEYSMCHIPNKSSRWGDQDVMICMPKKVKAFNSGFLMVISHKVHMWK